MTHIDRQSGSAFFIILIAIAMFAGLSYAVFRGGTGSQTQLSNDQARLAAMEIIAYGDALAKSVQTLKLRGCTDVQFDFENTQWTYIDGTFPHGAGSNPNAVSECKVFDISGGNTNAVTFPISYFNDSVLGSIQLTKGSGFLLANGLIQTGTAGMDLVYMLPHLKTNICMKINDILGVGNLPSTPPNFSMNFLKYIGNFITQESMTDTNNMIGGKSAFCAENGNNRFFRVLIAR